MYQQQLSSLKNPFLLPLLGFYKFIKHLMLCIRVPLGTFTSFAEYMVAQALPEKKATELSPTLRNSKTRWFIAHHNQRGLLLKTNPSMIVIGDSVSASLRIYPYVWKKYFPKSVNLDIGGD